MSEETERLHLCAAADALRAVFNAVQDPQDCAVLLNAMAEKFWPKAPWSNIDPHVADTATAQGGVGLLPYYFDEKGKIHVFLMRAAGTDLYQMIGGHIDFSPNGDRSIIDALLREKSEELSDFEGAPILDREEVRAVIQDDVPLDLKLIDIKDTRRFVMSYKLPLNSAQVAKLALYARMSKENESYRKTLYETSKHEVDGLTDFELDDLIANPDVLRHPDQLSALKKLQKFFAEPKVVGATPSTPRP